MNNLISQYGSKNQNFITNHVQNQLQEQTQIKNKYNQSPKSFNVKKLIPQKYYTSREYQEAMRLMMKEIQYLTEQCQKLEEQHQNHSHTNSSDQLEHLRIENVRLKTSLKQIQNENTEFMHLMHVLREQLKGLGEENIILKQEIFKMGKKLNRFDTEFTISQLQDKSPQKSVQKDLQSMSYLKFTQFKNDQKQKEEEQKDIKDTINQQSRTEYIFSNDDIKFKQSDIKNKENSSIQDQIHDIIIEKSDEKQFISSFQNSQVVDNIINSGQKQQFQQSQQSEQIQEDNDKQYYLLKSKPNIGNKELLSSWVKKRLLQ